MRLFVLVIVLTSFQTFAQTKGVYRYTCAYPKPVRTLQDSLPSTGLPILKIETPIVLNAWNDETLEIKSFRRFKINGSHIITTYGLNSDNPTVYGRYKVKEDTLVLTCKKSIQHFNKLAPKRRVKQKLEITYRFVLLNDGKLKTSEYCHWYLRDAPEN